MDVTKLDINLKGTRKKFLFYPFLLERCGPRTADGRLRVPRRPGRACGALLPTAASEKQNSACVRRLRPRTAARACRPLPGPAGGLWGAGWGGNEIPWGENGFPRGGNEMARDGNKFSRPVCVAERPANGAGTAVKDRGTAVKGRFFALTKAKTGRGDPFPPPAFRSSAGKGARRGRSAAFFLARFRRKRARERLFSQQNVTAGRPPGAAGRRFSFVNTYFAPGRVQIFLSASEKQDNRPACPHRRPPSCRRGPRAHRWWPRARRACAAPRFSQPRTALLRPAFIKKLKAFVRLLPCLYICKCFHKKII